MDRAIALNAIARSVHEAMRAYQAALGEALSPPWDEAGWMQDSSREAVEFALGNPTPGAQHEAWLRAKVRDGWTYGPVKNEAAKTHPSLRPFQELSETERTKDALLIEIVQVLAPLFGLSARPGPDR
ncbi:MAG TPA: RyR domain-containing protein [Polyangiaceae bacterium]|nr:RyR domain-containing protein [Polyangiaceae bacterium]